MLKNNKSSEEDESPPAEEDLSLRVKTLQRIVLAVCIITVLCPIALTVWFLMIEQRLDAQQLLGQAELIETLEKAEQRQIELRDLVSKHENRLDKTLDDINAGQTSEEHQRVTALRDILVKQQRDYQEFITVLEHGMIELSKMAKGSRDWTTTFSKGVERAQKTSDEYIDALKEI